MRRVAVITISLLLSTDRAQKFTALALANLVFLAGHLTVCHVSALLCMVVSLSLSLSIE